MISESLEKQIKRILALESNFDGENSPAYKKETIDKALQYIPILKEKLLKEKSLQLGEPKINLGPSGSIDVYWKTVEYELLLNVPIEEEPATYFGKSGEEEIRGKINLD